MASQFQHMSESVPHRRGLHLKEITTEGVADTVGGLLRATRLRLGEDLKSAARVTKIKAEYLECLEDGKIDTLPGRTYAIGFVRTYAEYLGLDGAECAARLKTEHPLPTAQGEAELGFPGKDLEREVRVPQGTLIIIGVVLILLVYAGVYLFRSANEYMEQRAKHQTTSAAPVKGHAAPKSAAANATPALGAAATSAAATPSNGDVAPDAGTQGSAAPVLSGPPQSSTPEPAAAGATDEDDVTPPADDEESAPEPPTDTAVAAPAAKPTGRSTAPATGAPAGTSGQTAPAAGAAGDASFDAAVTRAPRAYGTPTPQTRLVLRATENVFVRIATEGPRQQIVYQGVLAKGEVFYVPALEHLVLVTRNGGALSVYLDKNLKGSVGPRGVALSGLALAPQTFEH
jgi:cytoskeleton protein RodZ